MNNAPRKLCHKEKSKILPNTRTLLVHLATESKLMLEHCSSLGPILADCLFIFEHKYCPAFAFRPWVRDPNTMHCLNHKIDSSNAILAH